jgi:hypothetical protein
MIRTEGTDLASISSSTWPCDDKATQTESESEQKKTENETEIETQKESKTGGKKT